MVSQSERNPYRHQNLTADLLSSHKIGEGSRNQLKPPTSDDGISLRSEHTGLTTQSLNPFVSPNISTISFQSGNTSGHDEFHLERYSTDAKIYQRKNTAGSDITKRAKPDLNIITDFSTPKMPMKTTGIIVNEVLSKQVARRKARSVRSHKAIRDASTPPDQSKQKAAFVTLADLVASKKHKQRLKRAKVENVKSPEVQRIQIGLTVPEREAESVRRNMDPDSAFPSNTPETPAIIVTPADPEYPMMTYLDSTNPARRPVSSVYSAYPKGGYIVQQSTPPLPQMSSAAQLSTDRRLSEDTINDECWWEEDELPEGVKSHRLSHDSKENILLSANTESGRPRSQGWWNLVLSPLLRAGSVMSKKSKQDTPTPTVPPMPFTRNGYPSPIVSSMTEQSPETPRRQGLANTRSSVWSQWTEWEQQRELREAQKINLGDFESAEKGLDLSLVDHVQPSTQSAPNRIGLAAEYYHACAVEQATGKPYFECENHSCAEKWPSFQSIHDDQPSKGSALKSPFTDRKNIEKEDKNRMYNNHSADHSLSPDFDDINDRTELSPNDLSPNVRQANTAAVVKAKALDYRRSSKSGEQVPKEVEHNDFDEKNSVPLPVYSAPRNTGEMPNIAAITKRKGLVATGAAVESPGPVSPNGQRSLAPAGATAMDNIKTGLPSSPATVAMNKNRGYVHMPERPAFITHQTSYPDLPTQSPAAPITVNDLQKAHTVKRDVEDRRQRLEKEDAIARKAGGLWRGRGCFPKNGCLGRPGHEGRTKRRWIAAITLFLLAIIITSIVLAVTLTRHGDGTPVESQWLNLTGFPPIPTGISTIAVPNLVASQNQCSQPTTLWSCSVPKEDRDEIGSNDANQPNFRFEIRFQNGTVASNLTIPKSEATRTRLLRRASDPFSNDLFVPNPDPPNQPDQIFLGNTTDNITVPFDGEKTPFFITFISTYPTLPTSFNDSSSSSSHKRSLVHSRQSSNSSLLNSVPAPSTFQNGTSTPATLLPTNPFPISQPVHLYNRGLTDEHYGFYMYYDKTIFLSGFQIDNQSTIIPGSEKAADADQDGGCIRKQAKSVCTWSQTRFLVKMYTNPAFPATLLAAPRGSNTTLPNGSNKKNKDAYQSSATNFNRPGSFPYPTTILLDRHGGDIDQKAVYCYGINQDDLTVNKDKKVFVGELRSFGGQPINAAPTIGSDLNSFDQQAGGIDGGTGGCGCTWQNFE